MVSVENTKDAINYEKVYETSYQEYGNFNWKQGDINDLTYRGKKTSDVCNKTLWEATQDYYGTQLAKAGGVTWKPPRRPNGSDNLNLPTTNSNYGSFMCVPLSALRRDDISEETTEEPEGRYTYNIWRNAVPQQSPPVITKYETEDAQRSLSSSRSGRGQGQGPSDPHHYMYMKASTKGQDMWPFPTKDATLRFMRRH